MDIHSITVSLHQGDRLRVWRVVTSRNPVFQIPWRLRQEFAPAYCEDSDFDADRQVGKRAYLAANSIVVHLEGMSHGTDDSGGVKKSGYQSEKVFQMAHCFEEATLSAWGLNWTKKDGLHSVRGYFYRSLHSYT